MNTPTIINHEYLNQLEASIVNSEAYQRRLKEANENFSKNKELLIKAGILPSK